MNLRAADLYQQSGDSARSVALLERLVKEYPTPVPESIEVRQRLLDIAAKDADPERQRYWQQEIVRADASAGAARTERTRYLASRARLALALPVRDEFRSIKLVAPLKQSLVAKRKSLDAAVLAYKEVAEYQVAETTTAATYETAELYRTLAHDLLTSERPKKLSGEALEQYNALLDEQSFPFEEQAIAIHEINAKRVQDGVYDDSVRKSFAALAELKPARYGKTELGANLQPVLSAPVSPDTLSQAEESLKRATTLDPANAAAWSELGVTLRREGKFAEARAAYEHSLAADANYAPAYRNLGVLLDLYLGDPAAALPEMERYKALTAEDKPVSSWIAELRARTGIKPPAAPAPAPAGAAEPSDSGAPGATAAADHGGPT